MTNEEMERAMQFIVEHQARFAASQQEADERLTRTEANVAELTADQQQTKDRVARLEANMAEMAQSMANMARSQDHLSEVVAEMVDSQKHTQDKLDAFIGVLERYIAEGRNGKAGGEGSV